MRTGWGYVKIILVMAENNKKRSKDLSDIYPQSQLRISQNILSRDCGYMSERFLRVHYATGCTPQRKKKGVKIKTQKQSYEVLVYKERLM
jgi:hypothetical protein